jgi:GxxExxY protein
LALGSSNQLTKNALPTKLKQSSLSFVRQNPVPIKYKGLELECGYRIDLLIENELVIELKSVEELVPIFDAQILTYMKLAGKHLGLLINFNVPMLKMGIKRFVR